MKRALRILAATVAVWIVLLLILGWVFGRRSGEQIAARLSESMQATATVESSSLSLLRGQLDIKGIHARRDDLGVLDLKIGSIGCDLLPLGIGLFDRDCTELSITDMRLEVSSAALPKVQRVKRKPLHVDAVTVKNASFKLEASALMPDLGAIEVKIDRVDAGPTSLTTPLSWMFSLYALHASLDLPAGVKAELVYRNGEMTVTSSILGSAPVTVPLRLPEQRDLADAKAEVAALGRVGKQLAEELIERRAKDWIRSKIPSP